MLLTPEERDIQLQIIADAVDKLQQHFDSIQVIATFDMKDAGTTIFNYGKGNMFARYGSAKAWILEMENDGIMERNEED